MRPERLAEIEDWCADCLKIAPGHLSGAKSHIIRHLASTTIPDLIAYVRQLEARNAELEARFLTMGVDARRRM